MFVQPLLQEHFVGLDVGDEGGGETAVAVGQLSREVV